MYQLTNDPTIVTDLATGAWITVASDTWQAVAYAVWLAAGNTPQTEPAQTMAEATATIRSAIQGWLDATAQQNAYDSAASAVSYAGDPNATFNADGVAIRSWRSAVWTAAYSLEATLLANPPTPWPTAAQIIAQLPQPAAYGWTVHSVPTP